MKAYSQDLLLTASKLNTCTETLTFVDKLFNYAISVPFLSNIFTLPNENHLMDTKILYDQGKHKESVAIQLNSLKNG